MDRFNMDPKSQPGSGHSNPANLPVIPSPPGTRWREFRVRYIPLLTFLLTVVVIWRIWSILPPSIGVRGIGEGAVALICSPSDGFLQDASVAPYGWVQAGEPLIRVSPFDPAGRMDMFQSQMQLSRLALEPSLTDRNALNYEQLRVDSLRLKQELAMAKANLDRAEKTLPRHEALLKERLLAQDVYELTLRDRDFYRAEVEEKGKAIEQIDARLEALRRLSDPSMAGAGSVSSRLLPQLEAQIETMRTNWGPVILSAPIAGEVQFQRRPGEFVRAGEPILTINSPRADRIVAYVKQPIMHEPQVGAQVEVVTRSNNPKRFMTEISQVGARVEVITNAVAFLQAGAVVDTGLPFILPIPADVHIRPGEIVEVLWSRSSRARNLAGSILQK